MARRTTSAGRGAAPNKIAPPEQVILQRAARLGLAPWCPVRFRRGKNGKGKLRVEHDEPVTIRGADQAKLAVAGYPLGVLWYRGVIDMARHDAGLLYASLYSAVVPRPRSVASYAGGGGAVPYLQRLARPDGEMALAVMETLDARDAKTAARLRLLERGLPGLAELRRVAVDEDWPRYAAAPPREIRGDPMFRRLDDALTGLLDAPFGLRGDSRIRRG